MSEPRPDLRCPYRESVDWADIGTRTLYMPRTCAFYAGHEGDHRSRDGLPIPQVERWAPEPWPDPPRVLPMPGAVSARLLPAAPPPVIVPVHGPMVGVHPNCRVLGVRGLYGTCTCGWVGRCRYRWATAMADALRHARTASTTAAAPQHVHTQETR